MVKTREKVSLNSKCFQTILFLKNFNYKEFFFSESLGVSENSLKVKLDYVRETFVKISPNGRI